MGKEYYFSKGKNPYAIKLKKQNAIRLDNLSINYFMDMAAETGTPTESLFNMYLRYCAAKNPNLSLK